MRKIGRAVSLALMLMLLMTGCGSRATTTDTPSAQTAVSIQDTQVQPNSAGSQEIVSSGACVETYSPTTLTHRGFAFDGTIAAIELRDDPVADGPKQPWVTFKVNHWYKGGDASEVGVWLPGLQTSGTTAPGVAPDAANALVGTRLLVAGEALGAGPTPEDKIAWGCGFTQRHTDDAAAEWAAATAK